MIKRIPYRTEAAFISLPTGRHAVYSSEFKSVWQRMMRKAIEEKISEERFRFHDIRAKHATDRDEQKLNAQLALGHPDPGMTARYIRSKKGRRVTPLGSKIVEDGP